ncbi:uncharacterized protein LOC113290555 [Papaver somniferum]|uniref:uncharacterized protein LOC113290555 n=1 Tax=Papaver somniferum TaxID=3469 RepID=UPI000E6FF799|nr:uncharacterized protein LOC113290555 [Papaver somniferum]
MEIRQLDVKNAFLHGHLAEDVFMVQPPGYIDKLVPNHVCKVTCSNPLDVNQLILDLGKEFAIKDLGPLHFFLDIQATSNSAGGILSQEQNITNLLSPDFDDPLLYRSTVGALQYATTRPNILFADNKGCQTMHHPSEEYWNDFKRILRYLNRTLCFGLQFKRSSSLELHAYFDADWACDLTDRRSTSGMAIYMGPNLIIPVF